jgi:hypothetical protein
VSDEVTAAGDAAAAMTIHDSDTDAIDPFTGIAERLEGRYIDAQALRACAELLGKQLPEQLTLRAAVEPLIMSIAGDLGELWSGETSSPLGETGKHAHTDQELERIEARSYKALEALFLGDHGWLALAAELEPANPRAGRLLLLLHLWWECWDIWDRFIPYRTLNLVRRFMRSLLGKEHKRAAGQGQETDDWYVLALHAVHDAMRLIGFEGEGYKQINLSRAKELAAIASEAIDAVHEINERLPRTQEALARELAGSDREAGGAEPQSAVALAAGAIECLQVICEECEEFYPTIADAAATVEQFERWTERTTWCGSQKPRADRDSGGSSPPVAVEELRGRIEHSLGLLDGAIATLGQKDPNSLTLSRCEPWHRLMVELRELAANSPEVFVPRRVWVRYCYPFVVDHGAAANGAEAHQDASDDHLDRCLREELGRLLGTERVRDAKLEPLALSNFWQGGGKGIYRGKKVKLPTLRIANGCEDDDNGHYRAWIELTELRDHRNYCLCVERSTPFAYVLPHTLYRALHLGSSCARGTEVSLLASSAGAEAASSPTWSDLNLYAFDVVRATVNAIRRVAGRTEVEYGDDPSGEDCRRGNVREVLIIQTDAPLATSGPDAATTAERLDELMGGRILRTVHRSASTLAEWVRHPTLAEAKQDSIRETAAIPEIGFRGDWLLHSGDTSVIGIVATPSWLRDEYSEVAQFATSCSPLMTLWSARMSKALDEARRPNGGDSGAADELRSLDYEVRRHILTMRSEQLCQSRAHRRFLDLFLELTGVSRLEHDLQEQITAAEGLADWLEERARRHSERARSVLLFLISLLGVFGVAGFFALANDTRLFGLGFRSSVGDWLTLFAFLVVIFVGIMVLLRRPNKWLKQIERFFTRLQGDSPDPPTRSNCG